MATCNRPKILRYCTIVFYTKSLKPSTYTYSTSEFGVVTFQGPNGYIRQVVTILDSIVKISQTRGEKALFLITT